MDGSKTIYYLGNKDKIIDSLKIYFSAQGFQLAPYSADAIEGMEYLMLIEPIFIRSKHYIISSLWKNWLLEHKPQCKLMFAAYRQTDHPSALNLLDLPTNFSDWLKELHRVGAYQLQYAGHKELDGHKYDEYVDPWKFFPLPLGLDIKEEIIKFLNGHDRDNSFVDQLIRLRKSMMDLKDILETEKIDQHHIKSIIQEKEKIKESWALLNNRWENYKALFEWLPFDQAARQLIEELEHLANHIEALNLDNKHKLLPDNKSLDQINGLLGEKIQRYVYYESYW